MGSLVEELSKEAYASLVSSKDYAGIESLLNTKSISENATGKFLTELGVLDLLGPTNGEAFLSGIEAAASQMPVLNRIVRWLRSERGVDVGNAQVQTVLLQLVAANVVSSESANTIIAFGTHSVSIAEQQGLGTIGYGAIYNALKEMGIE